MSCRSSKGRRCRVAPKGAGLVVLLVLILAPLGLAERTKLKPGWNIFSPQQDVEMGRKVSQEAEGQIPLLNDRRVVDYLNRLGGTLAAKAPGERYPYQFKAVNDSGINAFALPGGFLYVNRGVIEAADNEAQLAGVMGHEIGHVALRHGTNQVSKAYAWQVPLAAFGGIMGSDSLGGVIAQVAAGFGVNSILLKYSRDAERQADIVGTQILYDSGMDPRAMAQFFEKIEAEGKRGRPPQWLSSHPNPENRMQNVSKEIDNLGGLPAGYRSDSGEFREIKRYVQSLPAPPKAPAQRGRQGTLQRPAKPSGRYQDFRNNFVSLRHPDNWRVHGQEQTLTLAPDGGIVDAGNGNTSLGYGIIVSSYEPRPDRHGKISLEAATDELIDRLSNGNPQMRVLQEHRRTRLGREQALATVLENESPFGGKERDLLVTVLRSDALVYVVCVAPESDYGDYSRTFQYVLDTLRFTGR